MPPKLRGKWALGITPRNLTWIIKDKLAICERPGGFGANHRRVRREVLPLLSSLAKRDMTPVLTRQAELLRDDDDLLNELAQSLDPTDALALAQAPLALARRAVRTWLTNPLVPDSATVERVLDVARGNTPVCDIGLGRQVRRSQQRLRITEPESTK